MVFTGLRRAGGIALAFAGLAVLLWGSWPARQIIHDVPYSYGKELALPAGWDSLQPPPALADGIFRLQWPAWIRLGEEGKIRLSLEETGSPSPCPAAVNSSTFTLASRLELPGVSHSPGSELYQPIIPCRPVFQAWTIHSTERGNFSGTVWLHLVVIFLHADFDWQFPVAAIPVDIKVISLVGLSGTQARLVGVLVILVGLALNIDLLVRRT
jgi:hypothetical protein